MNIKDFYSRKKEEIEEKARDILLSCISGRFPLEEFNRWRERNTSKIIDLSNMDLSDKHLSYLNLENAILSGSNLNGTDLRGCNLRGASFRGAKFNERTTLNEANIWGAKGLPQEILERYINELREFIYRERGW